MDTGKFVYFEDQAGSKTAMLCRSVPVHCLFVACFSDVYKQQSLPCWEYYRLVALFKVDTVAIKHSMLRCVSLLERSGRRCRGAVTSQFPVSAIATVE